MKYDKEKIEINNIGKRKNINFANFCSSLHHSNSNFV